MTDIWIGKVQGINFKGHEPNVGKRDLLKRGHLG